MGNVQQSKISAGHHRLKRRSGEIFGDVLKASLLLTGILLITSLLIMGYSQAMSTTYLSLRETEVRGVKELTEKDVLALAALKPAQNLLAVNADAIRDRIRKNPWVREVYVGRELPRRLVIEIRERTAFALLKKEDGFHLMDADGLAFKKLDANDASDLPTLTGCYRDGLPNQVLMTKAVELFRYLSTVDGPFSIESIAEIHGDEIFGFSIFAGNAMCLRLGFDHYDNKIKRLKPVLDDLEKRNVNLKYVMIDLTDPAKITVQKRHILAPATPGGATKGYRT